MTTRPGTSLTGNLPEQGEDRSVRRFFLVRVIRKLQTEQRESSSVFTNHRTKRHPHLGGYIGKNLCHLDNEVPIPPEFSRGIHLAILSLVLSLGPLVGNKHPFRR